MQWRGQEFLCNGQLRAVVIISKNLWTMNFGALGDCLSLPEFGRKRKMSKTMYEDEGEVHFLNKFVSVLLVCFQTIESFFSRFLFSTLLR
jgi:hypothetical protein